MTILLVRHAHAGDRHAWDGDDLQRPVSELGRRQSEGLVRLLGDRSVARVISSQATRSIQTVEPLAARLGLPVEVDERLWEDTPVETALGWIAGLAADHDEDVVLCSHGDLIGPLIEGLGRRGVDVGADPRWRKGSVWELDVDGDGVTSARYLPPTA